MKFTLERDVLQNLVAKACGSFRSRKAKRSSIILSACCARVFVHGPAAVSVKEALVFVEGQCELNAWMFHQFLKTFAHKTKLTLDADLRGIAVEKSVIPIESFSRHTAPPAHFQVFPITDQPVVPTEARIIIIPSS
jgi:hypothetical protein